MLTIKEIEMAKITNTVVVHEGYVVITVKNVNYEHDVLLDTEDLAVVGKVRVTNRGYAYTCGDGLSVANVVMGHKSNMDTVVDHINCDSLDNRKRNLRIVTQHQNKQNKRNFIRNNTGAVGIAYRKNGNYEYYRVSLTDRSKGLSTNNQGKRITKQFNINKLGKQVAFSLAKEYLLKKKIELGYLI